MKYFSNDPNGNGFEIHNTEEAARKAAEDALDAEYDQAPEGWSEEVTEICWGVLRQQTEEKNRRAATPEDVCYPDCSEYVEFHLVDVGA